MPGSGTALAPRAGGAAKKLFIYTRRRRPALASSLQLDATLLPLRCTTTPWDDPGVARDDESDRARTLLAAATLLLGAAPTRPVHHGLGFLPGLLHGGHRGQPRRAVGDRIASVPNASTPSSGRQRGMQDLASRSAAGHARLWGQQRRVARGRGRYAGLASLGPFRWSSGGGMQSLGHSRRAQRRLRVCVGVSPTDLCRGRCQRQRRRPAFRWTSATGFVDLNPSSPTFRAAPLPLAGG